MSRLAALLILAALVTACPTTGGRTAPTPIRASGVYVHAPSRFSFPERFGEFRRVEIDQLEAEGTDVEVGYNCDRAGGQVALSVFVMHRERGKKGAVLPLAELFEQERRNIFSHHSGVKLTHPWTPPQTANGEPTRGYAAAFRYSESFGSHSQELESLLYLFELDDWVVKYRAIYPAAQRLEAYPLAQGFVANFRWRGVEQREEHR